MNIPFLSEGTSTSEIDEILSPYTSSISLRFDWLNSIIALSIVFSGLATLLLGAAGIFDLGALPIWVQGLWTTVFLATIVWTFGPEVLQTVRGNMVTSVSRTVYDENHNPVKSVENIVTTVTKNARVNELGSEIHSPVDRTSSVIVEEPTPIIVQSPESAR